MYLWIINDGRKTRTSSENLEKNLSDYIDHRPHYDWSGENVMVCILLNRYFDDQITIFKGSKPTKKICKKISCVKPVAL